MAIFAAVVFVAGAAVFLLLGRDSAPVRAESPGVARREVEPAPPENAKKPEQGVVAQATEAGHEHSTESAPAVGAAPVTTKPVKAADDPVMREQRFRLNPGLSDVARAYANGEGNRFVMPLFDDLEYEIEIKEFTPTGPFSGAIVGAVAGKPGSFVVMAYYDTAEAGSIQIPEEDLIFQIRATKEGDVIVSQIDPTKLKGCGGALHGPDTPEGKAHNTAPSKPDGPRSL